MTILETLGSLFRVRASAPRGPGAAVPSAYAGSTGGGSNEGDTDRCHEGEILLARGDHEGALAAFQRAIDHGGERLTGHLGQARAYLALDRRPDAADSLEVALAVEPCSIDALVLLARIRRDAGELEEALDLLGRARRIAPQNELVLAELASTLNRCGNTEEAIAIYDEAIRVAPQDVRAKVNLGLIYLLQQGEPSIAESYFRSALAAVPTQIEASANLGLALHDQGRYDEEFEVYRQALAAHPESTELRWNLALANLSAGNFEEGWRGYELRFARRGGRDLSRFEFPLWDGARIASGLLLVLAEQGLGDEVMFASCIPDLGPMAEGIVLECAPRLEALFARSFPRVEVHGCDRHGSRDWLVRYPNVHAKMPIGSLPMRLRRHRSDFPPHHGYLRPDPNRLQAYRDRLAAFGTRIKVGISWRGGTTGTGRALRSISLAQMQPLLSTTQIQLVCLQNQMSAEEREVARASNMLIIDEALTDIDELAALIAALDLVVTVDNFNLHMAGALGRPAWGLLGTSPDWRWLRDGANSPWYPSILLFRAKEFGGWVAMLQGLAERLRLLPSS